MIAISRLHVSRFTFSRFTPANHGIPPAVWLITISATVR
jgi:hypothetical protein